jgi:hypothetical protein
VLWDGCQPMACAFYGDCDEERRGLTGTGMGSEGDGIGRGWGDMFSLLTVAAALDFRIFANCAKREVTWVSPR